MTDEQILKKAIERAEKNGFYSDTHHFGNDEGLFDDEFYHIIFSHDFVKGFVKYLQSIEPPLLIASDLDIATKDFLQNLVIQKEPLKYIEKYL